MSLYNSDNGFTDGPCEPGATEICVRICWVDTCPADWDLWVRLREAGEEDKWASYLNLGPIGPLGLELSADTAKPGEEGSVCDSPAPTCGLSPGSNGYAGEMVCYCISGDEGLTFPITIDVVVNLFGADLLQCPDPLGDVCVEYFCDDGIVTSSSPIYINAISGVFDFEGSGSAGNLGNGDYPQSTLEHAGEECADITTGTEVSICWVLRGRRTDGRTFVTRGPGRAPRQIVVPDEVELETCMLVEDGIEIPKRSYEILHLSKAQDAKIEMYTLQDLGFVSGKRQELRDLKRKKRRCKKCKNKGGISLF